MKTIILTLILTTCLFAQGNNSQINNNFADENKSFGGSSKDVSYSLGAVLGGNMIVSPKFIVNNLFSNINLQLMAMHDFGKHYQAELELNYTIFRNDNISHSLGVGSGIENNWKSKSRTLLGFIYSGTESVGSEYFKVNYSLMWKWLYFQSGFAIGNNNYSDGKLIIQLGYMYHF